MSDNPVYDTLVEERKKYGATMNDNECVELCNTVAWIHRNAGWGLNEKTGGTLGVRYDGQKCAHDILHHRPTNRIYDVLASAGAASTPVWQDKGDNCTPPNQCRPFVSPIVPQSGGGTNPCPELPSYVEVGGDEAGWKLGNYLFYDYGRAGQAPNAGMGVWFYRTAYDCIAGLDFDASLKKHRAEWCEALGIPVDDKEF